MRSASQTKGKTWERKAAAYLAGQGLEIIGSGYSCRVGELDLICRDGSSLVIVEVRARKTSEHASAAESVDHFKQQKIQRATRHFLMRNPGCAELPLRFDVVAVDGIDGRSPKLAWIKNAFDCS